MNKKWNIFIGGIAGNTVEWYDFSLYGFMIPVMTRLFFPASHHELHAIMLMLMFAISFFMRPIGALIYGHFGDTLGRKGSLVYSVILLGIPTFLMGCLPSFSQAGYLSVILLVILRFMQGISAGGEFGGSVVFCLEHAPKEKRGFYAALPMTAAMVGVALGSLVPALVDLSFSNAQLMQWAWRIPFLISIFIALLGFMMRKKLVETPVFEQLKKDHQLVSNPVSYSLTTKLKEIIKVAFIVAFGGVINYLIIIYIPAFLTNQGKLILTQATFLSFLSLVIVIISILIVGKLSNTWNRKILMLSIIIITLVFSWPLSHLLLNGVTYQMVLSFVFFSIIEGAYFGAMMAYLAEVFPAKIRYTSLSFGYNLGFAFFAGLAPLFATTLITIMQPASTISYVLFLSALISMIGVLIA